MVSVITPSRCNSSMGSAVGAAELLRPRQAGLLHGCVQQNVPQLLRPLQFGKQTSLMPPTVTAAFQQRCSLACAVICCICCAGRFQCRPTQAAATHIPNKTAVAMPQPQQDAPACLTHHGVAGVNCRPSGVLQAFDSCGCPDSGLWWVGLWQSFEAT